MSAENLQPKLTDERVQVIAEAIFSGKSQSEAYRIMHPVAKKWKNQTVHVKASLWANNGKVQGKLAELRELSAKRNDVTVDLISSMHKEAYMIAKNKKDAGSMTRAAGNLSVLHGLDKPSKSSLDLSNSDGTLSRINININETYK